MTSVGNNDRGTLVVPDNAVDGLSIYQRNYDAIYRKNANKDYIKDFLEQLKKEDVVGNEQTYIYQTKDRLINMYLGFVGVVVIGSDEVFNCTQKTWFGFSSQLFGKGLNASRIITYAASFGATTIDKLQLVGKKEIVSSLLHDLDAISVRDENSMKVIEELTGRTPWLHVDPVLMFDYNQFIPDKFNRNEYIIVYTYPGRITDKKEISSIRNFAKSKELKLISIGHYFSWCDEVVIPTPFEVLAYFKGASYIITDTFHGSVFSIKFNKEFCTIVRDMNSNKLVSLLKQFGLENRIVTDMNKMQKILETPIDYAGVNKIIMEETKRSITYLTQNIR